MRQYGGFKFSSPKGFSDWAKYAGFDRSTGAVPGGIAPGAGMLPVAPSGASSSGDLMQQVANAGAAMQQVGQGNFGQAYDTMFGSKPVAPAVPQPAQAQTQEPDMVELAFDYLSGLGGQ